MIFFERDYNINGRLCDFVIIRTKPTNYVEVAIPMRYLTDFIELIYQIYYVSDLTTKVHHEPHV